MRHPRRVFHRFVQNPSRWCVRERRMCVRGWTGAGVCYDERAERRKTVERGENLVGRGPPPLSKALALCHVAPHNEAARWVSVIAAPGPVFCLPWNGLLCREPVLHRPPPFSTSSTNPPTSCQETILYSRLGLHVRDTAARAFVGGC